jgi:low temperature requirement protein LtrA
MPIYSAFYGGFKSRLKWNEKKTDVVVLSHADSGEIWITIFIDLVYVAMFINLGHILEKCGHASDVTEMVLATFLLLFNSRLAIDEYANRFFADDIFHRLIYFLYTFGVFVMTLNVNISASSYSHRLLRGTPYDQRLLGNLDIGSCTYLNDYWMGFMLGLAGTRLALVAVYVAVCIQNVDARSQFGLDVIKHGLSSIIGIAAACNYKEKSISYFFAAAGIEIALSMLPKLLECLKDMGVALFSLVESFPVDIYHIQSRLGVFYMIVLGESMIQLLQRPYDVGFAKNTYYFLL